MAHELIDSVTVSPLGPVTIGLGDAFDITASFSLNGPNPGNPTVSGYTLSWQRISPGAPATFASESTPSPDTDYTHTCSAAILNAVGDYVIRVEGYYFSDAAPPNFEQSVDVDITVHVVEQPHYREIEADAPDRTATAGLEARTADAAMPARTAVAGMEARSVDATLPSRSVVAGAKEI
jgi:hypothetical protein